MVEESYFVPSGKVSGVTGLGRAKKFVGANGSISNAMFEKRPDHIARRRDQLVLGLESVRRRPRSCPAWRFSTPF